MKLAAHVVLPHSWFCNTTGAAIPLQQSRFCDIARKRKIGFATRLHYHGRVHCNRVLPAKRFCVSTSCRSPYSVADMKFAAPVVLPHSWFCSTAGAATLPKKLTIGFATLLHKPGMPQTSWLELQSLVLRVTRSTCRWISTARGGMIPFDGNVNAIGLRLHRTFRIHVVLPYLPRASYVVQSVHISGDCNLCRRAIETWS